MLRSVIPLLHREVMKVIPVRALEDNYMYIVYNDQNRQGFAVDVVEPKKLKVVADEMKISIVAALVTHHHWDHAGGMPEFRVLWPSEDIPIFGGDRRIDCINRLLKHEETFTVGGLRVLALSTPCHTKGHICYFVSNEDGTDPVVLTGDTLFIAGCGKFFEGTAEQMHRNLSILANLPDHTLVYPGHEYTYNNLKFANYIEPDNQKVIAKLAWAKERKEHSQSTVPSTIGEEKEINPFMRVWSKDIQTNIGCSELVECLKKLRETKDNFKG